MRNTDSFEAGPNAAASIWTEAQGNADGREMGGAFVLRAMNDSTGPHPSRSFAIPPSMPLHEPERFEDRNMTRLLLEHIDKQNRVLTQVVPACLAAMGGMVQGLSSHFGTLAETHESAIRTLRDSRVQSIEAERLMLADASRQARVDKLIDVGVAMLPAVIEQLGKKP